MLPLARYLAGRDKPGADLLRLRRAGDQIELQAATLADSSADVVRVYQTEGERVARDLRTQARTSDVAGLLAGALDDFILAYLRQAEARQAWK